MASDTIHQEDLKGEALLSQIQFHLGNEAMEEPVEGQGFCYPGLGVMHPAHGQQSLIFVYLTHMNFRPYK